MASTISKSLSKGSTDDDSYDSDDVLCARLNEVVEEAEIELEAEVEKVNGVHLRELRRQARIRPNQCFQMFHLTYGVRVLS